MLKEEQTPEILETRCRFSVFRLRRGKRKKSTELKKVCGDFKGERYTERAR